MSRLELGGRRPPAALELATTGGLVGAFRHGNTPLVRRRRRVSSGVTQAELGPTATPAGPRDAHRLVTRGRRCKGGTQCHQKICSQAQERGPHGRHSERRVAPRRGSSTPARAGFAPMAGLRCTCRCDPGHPDPAGGPHRAPQRPGRPRARSEKWRRANLPACTPVTSSRIPTRLLRGRGLRGFWRSTRGQTLSAPSGRIHATRATGGI
jgi:hypothetical protein